MTLDVHPLLDELTQARRSEGSMNTATMTFVVFFEDAGIAAWVRDRTHAVAAKHPSRVLVLDGTRPAGEQHAEPSETRGEWVEVGVRGADADAIASALGTLALPEAPIVLAWLSNRVAHDERFAHLAPLVHTVVVSSSVLGTNDAALRDFIAFVDAHPDIYVQDLAYLRLASWQEFIAEFFDEDGYMLELAALQSVDIAGGSEAEEYYFLGWLASRLGWTPCAENEFCNRKGEIVRSTMTLEGPPRRLARVILRSARAEFHAETMPEDPDAVCLDVRGEKPRPRRCAPLHSMDVATLVERGILTRPRDPVFHETLSMVKHIIDRRKG